MNTPDLFQRSVERLYDEITSNYDEDRFELLRLSRAAVLRQVLQHAGTIWPNHIVDFAVGTGASLQELSRVFPNAELTGLDLSRRMLETAAGRVPIRAIHADVRDASKFLLAGSAGLVLVHYLLGYVEPEVVIEQAAHVLDSGGLISIATSTFECFTAMQRLASSFFGESEVKRGSKVPDTAEALDALLDARGFEVIAKDRVGVDLHFRDLVDLYEWGTRSGWVAQYFETFGAGDIQTIGPSLAHAFPMKDRFEGLAVLARRK
jgi:predicted TPR repeat methyltransferase